MLDFVLIPILAPDQQDRAHRVLPLKVRHTFRLVCDEARLSLRVRGPYPHVVHDLVPCDRSRSGRLVQVCAPPHGWGVRRHARLRGSVHALLGRGGLLVDRPAGHLLRQQLPNMSMG